jgi:hypothetical protein
VAKRWLPFPLLVRPGSTAMGIVASISLFLIHPLFWFWLVPSMYKAIVTWVLLLHPWSYLVNSSQFCLPITAEKFLAFAMWNGWCRASNLAFFVRFSVWLARLARRGIPIRILKACRVPAVTDCDRRKRGETFGWRRSASRGSKDACRHHAPLASKKGQLRSCKNACPNFWKCSTARGTCMMIHRCCSCL